MLQIEVVFLIPCQQIIVSLSVTDDCSIPKAIELADIKNKLTDESHALLKHEKFDWDNLNIGIFGKKINKDKYSLRNNDRIEIYRSLFYTPNQRRLERLAKNK